MNEEKLKQILDKIGRTEVPTNVALIAERASRNFDAALKIAQPKPLLFGPLRLLAAAAVMMLVFAAGRWSKPMPTVSTSSEKAVYAQAALTDSVSQRNPESFWQHKAVTMMRPGLSVQTGRSFTEMLNNYKRYIKEKRYE